jgi:carbon storage regulator
MLILSRRKDESVVIDGGITVMVVEIRENSVRLGFTAPKETAVHRSEVQDAILRQMAAENRGREGE